MGSRLRVPRGRATRIVGALLMSAAALILAATIFARSGIYDIAASSGHWPIVQWFLEFSMRNSVALHAGVVQAPPLDNPNLIRLGAAYFHRGCAFCHGAPGIPVNPIAQHMLPSPPNLASSMRPWNEDELFWIVKHGLKYTGMPGWVALERDDEIWAMVAFLKRLPALDADTYRELALGSLDVSQHTGSELATTESHPTAVSACARCHGTEEQLPTSDLVPILHGQPAEYLVLSLKAYAAGKRQSGIMQPLSADLQEGDMRLLADYYAQLVPPRIQPKPATAALLETGRRLVIEGAPESGVPPCVTCHTGENATYPRLAGQHAAYMAGQLRLRKAGRVVATDNAVIMASIAKMLTEDQIEATSAYLASLPPGPLETSLPP